MTDPQIDKQYQDTYRKLRGITRRFHLLRALRILLAFLVYFVSIVLIYLIADALFALSTPLRLSCWGLSAIVLGWFTVKYLRHEFEGIFHPGEHNIYSISRQIGREDPSVADALVNFLQIYKQQGMSTGSAFRLLSLKQLSGYFTSANFDSVLTLRILHEPAKRIAVVMMVLIFLFMLFPSSFSQAALRLFNPMSEFSQPLPVQLVNNSGNQTVLKNDPVTLSGHYEGVRPNGLWLVIDHENSESENQQERIKLTPRNTAEFDYELGHATSGFTYWFEANIVSTGFRDALARSSEGRVVVRERPQVRNLQLRLTYPAYTALPPTLLPPNDGEITALVGTEVKLDIEANKRLKSAHVVFNDTAATQLLVSENRAQGQFTISEDLSYTISIVDDEDINNYEPIQYSVYALQDEHPYIEIAEPGQDLDLGTELNIPILFNLRDDFGFSKLLLRGRHIHQGSNGDTTEFEQKVDIQLLETNRGIADLTWDLAPFFLIPDDYIEYYGVVYDNDRIHGAKSSTSRTFVIRLPSLIESLDEVDENLTQQLEEMEDISEESKDLLERLDEINRELKRETELEWERKQEIQQQLDQQQDALDKLEEIQQAIQEQMESLQNQDMLSPETLEKYFELQEMMRDLSSPELMEAMENLQEAMENSDMDELLESMEQFQFSAEQFQQQIERTHELFKRVQQEQMMDELVNLAEKIAEDQQKVNEELSKEDLAPEEREQLAGKEEDIGESTDYLSERMEEARQEFQESLAEIAEQMQDAQEFMSEQKMQEQIQEMQQQIQQQQPQAQQTGEQIAAQMQTMQSMMQQMQQNMTSSQKQELMLEMQKVQNDLLRSSFLQEQFYERSRDSHVASQQLTEIAKDQAQLRDNARQIMQQIMEVSKKSFHISPQMNQNLASMMENMEDALSNLEERNSRNAANAQQRAMASMNEAILGMQGAMNQMMQSSSASGFEEFMEQLQAMSGQQGQLNQGAMSLFQKQGQQGTQPSPEALARMAAEQAMIRQSLDQMNQQMGSRPDMLGRLGELGDEMEKVIKDLQSQRLDRKVIERQQRILSRMLDAQKSVREREYSRKRLAEREENAISKSPPQLKQELLERENRLRKELLEALKEGYSTEYKELIKAYYEVLSRQLQEE